MTTEMPVGRSAVFLAAKTPQMHASPGPVGPHGFAGITGLQTGADTIEFLRGL